MKRALSLSLSALLLAGCAANTATTPATTVAANPAPVVTPPAGGIPATTGIIAKAESGAPAQVQQGGNAALAIGASALGAFIPGPWGSVASVATGQMGQVALQNYQSGTVRYTVRMSDGTVRTIAQNDALAMPAGTPVEFVTLSNGTQRIVQTAVTQP